MMPDMSSATVATRTTVAGRLTLAVLVFAWGGQAIVAQAVLLREAMVLAYGSELAWGIVFFAWLLGVAIGASVGGWLSSLKVVASHADTALTIVLLTQGAAVCGGIWALGGARGWLHVGPGELITIGQTTAAALLMVAPASALIGMAFPLACCVRRPDVEDAMADKASGLLAFGHVYALEAAGSLVGGALFSFWAVERLTPIATVVMFWIFTMAVAGEWLATRRRPGGAIIAWMLGAALLAAVLLGGDTLHRKLVHRRFENIAPGYDLVAESDTRYQNLALGRRGGQSTLYANGHAVVDFPDPYTFVPLAHLWMCQHPAPRQVLLIGGGAEGLLNEVLRHPVEHVDLVMPDPRQLDILRPQLAPDDLCALRDARVRVHHVDARYFIKTRKNQYDIVLARLPEPTSALNARFWTDEFFGELRRAMTDQAVLCTTVAAAPGELADASRDYVASVRATLARHFPHVLIGWGDPAQLFAATAEGLLTIDPAELTRRYVERGIESPYFDPAWFDGATDWLDPQKIAQRSADLDRVAHPLISTDLQPYVYVQRLVLWEAATGGGHTIARLRSIGAGTLSAGLALAAALVLIAIRLKRRRAGTWAEGAVTLSVGTTGLVTMALSIAWLFAFQNLYGYVYQRIGWIVALFMAGLVIGCLVAERAAGKTQNVPAASTRTWRRLIAVDLLLAVLALAAPFVLRALANMQTGATTLGVVEWCVSIMVVLTGLLGGAAFPLAGRLQLAASQRPGRAAGTVVAADHAGACLGALLCGVLMVPLYGILLTALILAGLKLLSALLLVALKQPSPAA